MDEEGQLALRRLLVDVRLGVGVLGVVVLGRGRGEEGEETEGGQRSAACVHRGPRGSRWSCRPVSYPYGRADQATRTASGVSLRPAPMKRGTTNQRRSECPVSSGPGRPCKSDRAAAGQGAAT